MGGLTDRGDEPPAVTFDALYRRDFRALVALAYGLSGNRSAAEELVQEAFPAAHRGWAADRRAQTQGALLEAAARGLSRDGYSNLVLERVAAEAGYTRGALYHLFDGKEALALAVVEWVREAWYAEVGSLLGDVADPIGTLIAVARGHAVFCRRDIARVMITLRVEFSRRDHPVGQKIRELERQLVGDCARLISAGRRSGAIPSGPPVRTMARAYLGAVEGLVISLAGQAPFDAVLAERAARGVLGLPPAPDPATPLR